MQLKGPPTVTINGVKYPITLAHGPCSFKRADAVKFVYVIATGEARPAMSKVGIARDVDQRFATLQSSSPVKLRVFYRFELSATAADWVEQTAHETLRGVHTHNEWFQCTPRHAAEAVKLALRHVPAVERFYRETDVRHSRQWREIVDARPRDDMMPIIHRPPTIEALVNAENVAPSLPPHEPQALNATPLPLPVNLRDMAKQVQSVMDYAERLKQITSA